ncbi:MAG: hypothetical protein V4499_04880 [Pseudomonadota bacterium]
MRSPMDCDSGGSGTKRKVEKGMQSLAPTSWVVGAITFEAILAIVGVLLLRRSRWRKGWIVFLSAVPVPAVLILLCIVVFVSAATASKEACGVDACGMAMAGAMMLVIAAVVLYLIGTVIALLTAYLIGDRSEENVGDIFE